MKNKQQQDSNTLANENGFDYNNPIKANEIEVLSYEDNGRSKITAFKYDGRFFRQQYNYGKNFGFKFLFEYENEFAYNHRLSVANGEQMIYSTTLESNCTAFGKFLEYSLTKNQALKPPTTTPKETAPTEAIKVLSKEIESIERNCEKINQHTWETYKRQISLHIEEAKAILNSINNK